MYKVFFKDRIVFFTTDFSEAIKKNNGLFYKFGSRGALTAVVRAFYYLEEIKELYLIHPEPEKLWKEFCHSFTIIRAGGGLVTNSRGELLFIRRSGLWDLPKGKSEKKESLENTALREVSEECGIMEPEIGKHIVTTYHTYEMKGEFILKETHWFSMLYRGNDQPVPQLSENITKAMWIRPSEISYISGNTYKSILQVLKTAGLL